MNVEVVKIKPKKPKSKRRPNELCVILRKKVKNMPPSSQHRIPNILLGLAEMEEQDVEFEDETAIQ